MRTSGLLASHAFAALMLASAVARADGASVAAELFRAGVTLADGGNYADACPKFAESARLDPHVGTLARLGECEEKLGHTVDARLHWGQARDLATRLGDNRRDHAEAELARVDAIVAKLLFTLPEAAPPGFVLAIDATTLDAASLGVPIPVEPGPHSVRAEAPGKLPFVVSVTTKADGAVTAVAIALVDAPVPVGPSPTPEAPPELPPPAPTTTWSGYKTGALVAAGAGVVAAGVGVAFGLGSFSSWHHATGLCSQTSCSPGAAADRSSALDDATISTAAFTVAGVGIAAAAVLWIAAPRSSPGASALHVIPVVGPGVAGLRVTGALGL